AGQAMASINLQLVDPGQLRLKERQARRVVHSEMAELGSLDADTQRELAVQQLLEQAFQINASGLRNYLRTALGQGRRIDSRDLPVENAADLLALSHIISLGSADHAASGFRVRVQPTGQTITGETWFNH